MAKICYVERTFSPSSIELIEKANEIIAEYHEQGFDLTLRQLYYQFVSRDIIRNNMQEYKRLGSVVNDARLAGQIDWDAIEDRTRNLKYVSHWETPEEIIASSAGSFRLDKWTNQSHRVEVWIEKDALVGVIEPVCWDYAIKLGPDDLRDFLKLMARRDTAALLAERGGILLPFVGRLLAVAPGLVIGLIAHQVAALFHKEAKP